MNNMRIHLRIFDVSYAKNLFKKLNIIFHELRQSEKFPLINNQPMNNYYTIKHSIFRKFKLLNIIDENNVIPRLTIIE